jgi:hypothetical protein
MTRPFSSPAAAWFWAMRGLQARRDGAAWGVSNKAPAGAEIDDVVKVLDRLYRQRRITLEHARILRIYGERGTAPNESATAERNDARLWREAMERMELPLQCKGIVATRERVVA